MVRLGDIAQKVRSKNAGPFWLTVDIFCGSAKAYAQIAKTVETTTIASLFGADPSTLKRFDIEALYVVKFSLPRPCVQGAKEDRDMHGASWAALVKEMLLE